MNRLFAALSRVCQDRSLTFVDCGARGDRAPKWLFQVSKNATFLGIEPDADECAKLNRKAPPGHTYLPVCLARVREERTFHVTRNPACSSLLKPNHALLRDFESLEPFFEIVEDRRITTIPLDSCLPEHGIRAAHFIELDTQGSELDILLGVDAQVSGSVAGVKVEVEFAPMYESQPLFADVDAHLRGRGFHLFDLSRYRVRRTALPGAAASHGQLLWGQAIYLRDYKLLTDLEARENVAIVAAAIGFRDYAAEIIDTLTSGPRPAPRSRLWRLVRRELEHPDVNRLERFIDRGLRWKCGSPIRGAAAVGSRISDVYGAVKGRKSYFAKD